MTVLNNARIVTGDGVTVIDNGAIAIEGNRITEVYQRAVSATGDDAIDLEGRLIVPGAINAHAHACTLSPLFASGAPGVSREQVIANLDRHLSGGTTTVLNVDGFNIPSEIDSINAEHPIHVKAGTTHFPLMIETARQSDGSGLGDDHEQMTVAEMVKYGAAAVAELGAGHTLAGGGQDYMYIPMAVERETGVRLEPRQAQALKYAVLGRRVNVESYDEQKVADTLADVGLKDVITPERARQLIHDCVLPAFSTALEGIREGARIAADLKVPAMIHTSAPSETVALEAADIAGSLLVSGHTNHSTFSVEESVACAKELRVRGAVIEVSTLDAFGDKRLVPTPENIYALLERDLVDIVATDYAGGHWDNIYYSLGQAIDDGVVDLPKAVSLATRNVALAFPRLAPERGELKAGNIADLVVCGNSVSNIESVYVDGKLVSSRGRVLRGEETQA